MHSATLDTLVGSGVRPAAANIPRGTTLQTIAAKTGRSLDWLLGFDVPEFRGQTRSIADLADDVAAHVKRAIYTQLGPPESIMGEREEWLVVGHNALQLAVDQALLQAKESQEPTVRRVAVLARMVRDEPLRF